MTYDLDGITINVIIIKKNNKNIYMRFKSRDTLEITCNHLVTKSYIEKLLEKNKASLRRMQIIKEKETLSESYFCYLGKKYIAHYDGVTKDVYFDSDLVIAKDESTLNKFYKKECLRLFTSEVERITPYFKNIPKFTLKIRKMSTRWGVNNYGSHTITLNSELLKRDIDLLDYVIIHELCHFYEPNHSPRFWAHVEEYYPKYKEARRRLRVAV